MISGGDPMSDRTMDRRTFVGLAAAGGAAAVESRVPALARGVSRPSAAPFELEDATIAELQAGMKSGKYTARGLTAAYVQRIDALDRKGPALRAVLEMNPDALVQAEVLDAERKAKGPRGPLHGVPVLVKDNIATRDRMQSTAGSLALVGVAPPRDAFIVERLRASGAVILGKANLSEWANFRSTHSSSGWSGRGGQCRNPYALDRTPSGSSSGSGVAVAANLCPVAIGTESDGSIGSPSTCCSIVGIKPTLGRAHRPRLPAGARQGSPAGAHPGDRRRDGRAPARRAHRAHGRTARAHRPRERRPRGWGQLLVARGRGRLSARHRAAGLRGRPARGAVVRRTAVERGDADQAGVRVRAGDESAPAPALLHYGRPALSSAWRKQVTRWSFTIPTACMNA